MDNWMSFINLMRKEAGREDLIKTTEPVDNDLFDEDCRLLS